MSGFRAIEDFGENLRLLRSGHWLVPTAVVSTQVPEGGLKICGRDGLGVREETVLIDEPTEVFSVGDEPQEKFLVQLQIFRSGRLVRHALFLLLTEKLDFVKPDDDFTVNGEARIRAEDQLSGWAPILFRTN